MWRQDLKHFGGLHGDKSQHHRKTMQVWVLSTGYDHLVTLPAEGCSKNMHIHNVAINSTKTQSEDMEKCSAEHSTCSPQTPI